MICVCAYVFVEANSTLSSVRHALVFCFVMHANRVIQVTVRGQTVWNPDFSNLPITRTKSRFPYSVKHCNFIPDFSESPIFRTNFCFPWSCQESGFHLTCIVLRVCWNLLNQQQVDSRYNFTRNLTGNTVKYDSSAPCRQWCSSIFAKKFSVKV